MANELPFWKRFFSPKDEVHKHWYVPLDNFDYSSNDFYQSIEKELQSRKVPGLELSRVNLSEGGLLSEKREYLRLKRERLVFDICAAPFGTSYFFSFRLVELPLGIKIMELVIFLVGCLLAFGLLVKFQGFFSGVFIFFGFVALSIFVVLNARALGLESFDANLVKTPVLGPLYEMFFRKETYHRQDTRLMYLSTVNSITEMLVEEVTAAKGIKLLKQYERKPPGGDLYQATTRHLGGDGTPKPAP